jgi:hypothetical protein
MIELSIAAGSFRIDVKTPMSYGRMSVAQADVSLDAAVGYRGQGA